MVWPTFNILVKATHNSVSETCRYFNPVVKPSAASTSSDVTASTSEALSTGTAPPHRVSILNDNTPFQPVLTSYQRRAFGWMERWSKEKEPEK